MHSHVRVTSSSSSILPKEKNAVRISCFHKMVYRVRKDIHSLPFEYHVILLTINFFYK